MDFNKLRQKHPYLVYKGFKILTENGGLKVTFNILLAPDIAFNPFVVFPSVSKERLDDIGPQALENLVFNLGMIELLSYWKAACPPQIVIKAGLLNQEQIKFWKNLLVKGLGEFFYTNKIDFTKEDLVEFISETSSEILRSARSDKKKYDGKLKDRDLILVGGGKDSAVTLDILKKSGRELNLLLLNPNEVSMRISKLGGCEDPIIIKRTIDPKLLDLSKTGYLNGHTPYSAYLAFLSVFAGVLYDYKNLVVSNEASSNEGNIVWKGAEINHQYSKTFEFESLFREYCKKHLSLDSNYFSFLRPLFELQIAKLFAAMPQYHQDFRSCNKGSKEGVWCGKCPKCVSTYLLLYPFLGIETKKLFTKDLLADQSLVPIVKGLIRENDVVKPFECVATIEEMRTAIFLSIERVKNSQMPIPVVLQAVSNQALDGKDILETWNSQNNLAGLFRNLLEREIKP